MKAQSLGSIFVGLFCVLGTGGSAFASDYWSMRLPGAVGETKAAGELRELGGTSGTAFSVTASTSGGGQSLLHVPIDGVPDGATITQVAIWGDDAVTGSAMTFRLRYASLSSESTITDHSSWSSADATDSWSVSPSTIVLQRSLYTYWVEVSIPSTGGGDFRVHSLRVTYTP
jgi:hypothetical protein